MSVTTMSPSIPVERPGPGEGPTPPPPTPNQPNEYTLTFSHDVEGPLVITPRIVYQFSFTAEVSGQLVAPDVETSGFSLEQIHSPGDSATVELKHQINSFFAAKVEAGITKNDRSGKFDPTLSMAGEFGINDNNKFIVGFQGDLRVPVKVEWERTFIGESFETTLGMAKVDIVGTFRVALGPGPAVASAFWSGGGAVAGLAIGTAAFWVIFFEAFAEAEQKAQRVRRNSSRRVGFAAGIAAILEDEFQQRNIDDYANGYGSVDRVWFLEGVQRAYWEMQKGATAEREARRRDLQARFAAPDANGVRPDFKTITDNVMRALGGFDNLDQDVELSLP